MRLLATVRARTALGASLALGIALVLSASTAGALLRRSLIRNIDEVAEVRAVDVAGLAYSGELAEGLASQDGEIVQGDGSGGFRERHDLRLLRNPFAVLTEDVDGDGRRDIVAVSEGGFIGIAYNRGGLAFDPWRYFQQPYGLANVIATGLDGVEHNVAVLSRLVFLGLPALLGLVALSAWLAVGRALRPVEAIRAEVADISARELDRRVPQSGAGDEVDRLAQTMNAMLDRLEASAVRQRRFVADSSEELVAPLAATRDRLETALAGAPDGGWPTTGAELLRQHRRMERLVRDLLYLARVDAGAPRAPLVPVDLDDVVLSEVTRLRGTGPIRFETTAVSAAPIEGRPEDLRRAVRNLLEHAERQACSTVRVGLWTGDDGHITLVVEDDGNEELPAEADRIFRLPAPSSSAAGETGSGLALAIVRHIAVAHGGRVTVEAAVPGSRFVLELPAGPAL